MERGGRARHVAVVSAATLLALLLALGASSVAALRVTCAPELDVPVCRDTLAASLSRGLAPFHPLIVSAHVEPGPAAGPDDRGHRATVTFELLGVPTDTSVRLFYDMGGHWGGVPDRSAAELAAWALVAPAAVMGITGFVLFAVRRRRPR